MGFYAGTSILGVKMMIAQRAQASGHRHIVPESPDFINLYFNGELVADDIRLNREHHRGNWSLFP